MRDIHSRHKMMGESRSKIDERGSVGHSRIYLVSVIRPLGIVYFKIILFRQLERRRYTRIQNIDILAVKEIK